MKGLENSQYLFLYILANLIAIIMLVISWKSARWGRILFFILFAWACWMNWKTVLNNPDAYLEYGELSLIPIYKKFIDGWFGRHILLVVGSIACCQGLIAISMLGRNQFLKSGCYAGMIFLLSILPLGVGSGFPATLFMAAGLWLISRTGSNRYIWASGNS